MPILPQEPDIFPEQLLGEQETPATDTWWLLYCLARKEKVLSRRLRALEIAHYCPMVKRQTRSSSGRVRTSHVPLFAGYAFLRGDEEVRYRALQTNCVSKCMPVGDPERLVRDLKRIQQLIASEAPLTPEARLTPGMRVRVRSGPLAGLEGTILERRGQTRLLVAVEFIQRGASVQIGDYQLERIDF
jgi:transcriptional antiterminator RfaH